MHEYKMKVECMNSEQVGWAIFGSRDALKETLGVPEGFVASVDNSDINGVIVPDYFMGYTAAQNFIYTVYKEVNA